MQGLDFECEILFQSNIQRRLITVIANLFLQIANAMGIMNSTSRLVTIRFNAECQFTVLITMRVYVLWNRTKWIVIVLIIVGLSTETTAAILFLYSSVKGTCKLFVLSFVILSKAHARRYAVTYVESENICRASLLKLIAWSWPLVVRNTSEIVWHFTKDLRCLDGLRLSCGCLDRCQELAVTKG